MKNNKNCWVIPTDKPSRLLWSFEDKRYYSVKEEMIFKNQNELQNQNIYITSDEEIKEENLTEKIYVVDIQNGNIGKLTCKNRFFKGSSKLIEIEWKNKQNIWNYNHIKKIILTTDQDFIAYGVQSIDDEFLEWFCNNSSCEEVEVEKDIIDCKKGLEFRPIVGYKIIIPKEDFDDYHYKETFESRQYYIPKEEPKQESVVNGKCFKCGNSEYKMRRPFCTDEFCNKNFYKKPKQELERGITITHFNKKETLEEAAERTFTSAYTNYKVRRQGFIEGAKWQAERMHSKEDLKEAFEAGHKKGFSGYPNTENWKELPFKEWLKQFKKK